MIRLSIFTALIILLPMRSAWSFDHQHTVWNNLLKQNVVWLEGGHESKVNYRAFKKDPSQLRSYLASISEVKEQEEFITWTKPQQLAFLINAYNAFTVDLILTRYPDLESIRDLGSLFKNPWKKKFFTLFARQRNLDYIEHTRIREEGIYNEPRIHVAVVCASIGCPALRNEAYVADKLNEQLEDSFIRFLSDRSRNRYDSESGSLEVSSIFDWYAKDFSRGWRGYNSVPTLMAIYAEHLSDDPREQQSIREQKTRVNFLDYDWKLNDLSQKKAALPSWLANQAR